MHSFTRVSVALAFVVGSLGVLHCGDDAAVAPNTNTDGGTNEGGSSALPPACVGSACTKAQAVAKKIALPTNKKDFAADLDGDGNPDNALGSFISALSLGGFDVQTEQDSKVNDGTVILLLDEAAADATFTSGGAVVTMYVGKSQPGAKFDGTETFTADTAEAPSPINGTLTAGAFATPPPAQVTGVTAIKLGIAIGSTAIAMPFYPTQVKVTNAAGKPVSAQINGAYKKTDIDTILIPGIAAELTRIIAGGGQQAGSIKGLFDKGGCAGATANDNVVSPCEVSKNFLIQTNLAPDVQLFDASGAYKPVPGGPAKDSLSAGFSVELVGAKF